jgi:hypothetical protein
VEATLNTAVTEINNKIQKLSDDVDGKVTDSIVAATEAISDLETKIDGEVAGKLEDVASDIDDVAASVVTLAAQPKVTGVTAGKSDTVVPASGGYVTIDGQFGKTVKVTYTLDGTTKTINNAKVSEYGDRVTVLIPKVTPKASKCVTTSPVPTGVADMLLKIYSPDDSTEFQQRVIKIDSNSGEFGDGRDGDKTISTTLKWGGSMGASKSFALDSAKLNAQNKNGATYKIMVTKRTVVGFACGDKVVIINMGSYTAGDTGTGAVQWGVVQSVSGKIITLQGHISASILDKTKGSTSKIIIQRVPQYKKLIITGNGEIVGQATNFDSQTAVVAFVAHEIVVTTNKPAAIVATQIGYMGGRRGTTLAASPGANDAMALRIQGGHRGQHSNRWGGHNKDGAKGGAGCGIGNGGAGGASEYDNWAHGGNYGISGTAVRYSKGTNIYIYSRNQGAGSNGNRPGGGGGGGADYQYGGAGGGGAHCSGKTYSVSPTLLTLGGGAANGGGGGSSDYNSRGGEPWGLGGKARYTGIKNGGYGGAGGRGGGIVLVNVGVVDTCCGTPKTLFINAKGGAGGGGGGGSGGTHKDGGGGGGQGANGAAGGSAVVRIGSGGGITYGHIDVSGGVGGGGGGGAGVPNQHNPSSSGGGGAGAGIGGGGGGGTRDASWGCGGGAGQDGLTGKQAASGETARGCKSYGAANGGGGGTYGNSGSGGAANKGGKGSDTICNKGMDATGLDGGDAGRADGHCGGDGNRGAGGGGGGSGGPGMDGLKIIH